MSDEPINALHDRQAEEALLGSVLINSDVLSGSDLQPADFHLQRNRWIWEAFRKLEARKEAIDYLTVCGQLEADGHLAEVGGTAYVMGLINETPTSMHAAAYAGIVRELATRRQVLRVANALANAAFDRKRPVDAVINESMVTIPQLARVKTGAQHISVYAKRHAERLEELHKHPAQFAGIPTGYSDYDDITGGLRKGELLLLLGKPGLGKTMWLLTAGFQMGGAGYGGAVYEMETSEEASLDRELSRRTNILTERLETGSMTAEDWTAYCAAIEALSDPDLPVYLSFETAWTTASLRADLTRLKADYGIEWFVVDYLKFLNDSYGSDETERQNFISKQLKRICRDLELAGAVIHSMNKAGLGAAIPDLDNMSQGADIAFDCDKALFMVEHSPRGGQPVNPNGRTFVFKKSRSKIKRPIFHMEKLPDFPAFRPLAGGETETVSVSANGKSNWGKKKAATPAYEEPDWTTFGDLDL
jgi:replicative DNA helicase